MDPATTKYDLRGINCFLSGSIGRMVTSTEEDTIDLSRVVRFHLSENEMRLSLGNALDNIVEQRTLFFEAVRVGKPGIFKKPL